MYWFLYQLLKFEKGVSESECYLMFTLCLAKIGSICSNIKKFSNAENWNQIYTPNVEEMTDYLVWIRSFRKEPSRLMHARYIELMIH